MPISYQDIRNDRQWRASTGLTYDLLALSFGMDRATAFRQQTFTIRILEMPLQKLNYLPKRFFEDLSDFKSHMAEEEQLLLHASEQKRQRPQDHAAQKENYSGKKKRTP